MSGHINFDILKFEIKLPTCRLAWVSVYVYVSDILVLSLSYSFKYKVFMLRPVGVTTNRQYPTAFFILNSSAAFIVDTTWAVSGFIHRCHSAC